MLKALRRWWKYIVAKVSGDLEAKADPKVQIQQAITEAQEQHGRLKDQAASVIANQKQLEMQLSRTMGELEKTNANARQALMMQAEAAQAGNTARVEQLEQGAQAVANRLIELEKAVDSHKAMLLQATQASDQAKAAVEQNGMALQKKLAERQKLLSQLDQAKMQEQLNTAMASLSETVGADVPTFNEVRDKIEARYAKAMGASELAHEGVEVRMLEIEQATQNNEARGRLDTMRAELGLPVASLPDPLAADLADAAAAETQPVTGSGS